jgi:hypothetical protein
VKPLTFSRIGQSLHIDNYPDAVGLKRIDDPISRQLQAMTLHHDDLGRCCDALDALWSLDRTAQPIFADALWVSALARYFKCFGVSQARAQLSAVKVLKGQAGAMAVFKYFQSLRDKHVIHDENPYSQAFTAVALNGPTAEAKVADVVSLAINSVTADESHIKSFSNLARFTFEWVSKKHEELHNVLGAKYEQVDYATLLALPDVVFQAPTVSQVVETR